MLLQFILQLSEHAYCVSSVASDNGRSRQGSTLRTESERFSDCVCGPHRLNRGLEQNVCVVQCITHFQCFTSSTTSQKYTFSFFKHE